MSKKLKFIGVALLLAGIALLIAHFLNGRDIAVLSPKGLIAAKERHLMITATLLMLIVVIPVFILTIAIAWRYRETNQSAKYTPDWDHHLGAEFTWWAIPTVIITVLAIITWQSSHQLDPFKALDTSTRPLNIQVVALQWKWLFIYPEQHIATVNYVQFPEATPINFNITSDAPMNSFWIPRLGGQIYAMAGMSTQLHLIADQTGSYEGSSANLSGRGFASMNFMAKSVKAANFADWVQSMKSMPDSLSYSAYNKLAAPSTDVKVANYSNAEANLYDNIVMKYMMPMSWPSDSQLKTPVTSATTRQHSNYMGME